MANPQLEMRKKNEDFLKNVRANKPTAKKARSEVKKSPLGMVAISIIGFVVFGGVIFELARLIFL
ncbi:hypothetical protein FRB94_001741 [Tulasnella sp. JGI-2019a]|nr:hypothetical protein FRB93_007233 [Tulasnella sp. JGI-2019a]KAG9013636.1 hypothetical protein FRB94_001741 [Tulasnella sp. JGI-2019a]KAG9035147.1 hypothetical protein FRB95_012014 [Tulasnella sp. JGI-2019a]